MLDVDAMLDSMTPQQFDEWLAYYSLEPFSDGWMQAGIMSATFHNEIESIRCGLAGHSRLTLHDPDQYIPTKEAGRRRPTERMSVQEMEEKARTMAGLP